MDTPEHNHELIMPFNCVQSRGGAYEDTAFVAGYRCGLVDAALAAFPEVHRTPVEHELRGQMDLLAMRYGYVVEIEAQNSDWLSAVFWRKPAFGLFKKDELEQAMRDDAPGCHACGDQE